MLLSLIFIATSFVVFGVLAKVCPCNAGTRDFSRDTGRNVVFWLLSIVLYADLTARLTKLVLQGLYGGGGLRLFQSIEAGRGWLAHLPVLVQAILIIFLTDVMQYWLHRAFHTRWLWPFHAVHHSPRELDWTATWRIHPVNFIFYDTLAAMVILLMGFSPLAFAIVAPFNFFTAALVHANLDWTFGPFRLLFASPVFHRWHHAIDPAIHDKNFAPTFPFLDVMFGTFHMPKGELPDAYGVEGAPEDVVGLLAYPFLELGRMLAAAKGRAPEAAARP